MINRNFFFERVRGTLFGGKLKPAQVEGLGHILDVWERANAKKDDRWLAYMLATTHHETDRKMQPIEEYGRGKGRKYGGQVPPGSGKIYYGRGFVQLTWDYNYKSMGKLLGVDLLGKPELALDLDIATKILFLGMTRGSFTGKKLGDYFSPAKEDWVNARRIINGTDKANLIADYAKHYYASISYTTG